MLSFIFLHIIVCMLCVYCYCWWFKDTASIFLFQVFFRDIYGTYATFWTWWSVTNNQVAYLWLQELFPAFIWSIGTIEETSDICIQYFYHKCAIYFIGCFMQDHMQNTAIQGQGWFFTFMIYLVFILTIWENSDTFRATHVHSVPFTLRGVFNPWIHHFWFPYLEF